MSSAKKYQHVRSQLEAAIEAGEFGAGDQLPGEHVLAERFGVSYMTARRAVSELVEADLLERHSGKGTFVRRFGVEKLRTTTLNLITSAYESAFTSSFLQQGLLLAQEQGWRSHIIRLSAGEQEPAVRALSNGELGLVMLDEVPHQSALGRVMSECRGKAVSIGRDMSQAGIPSILSSAHELLESAVSHLAAHGHRDIVFVFQTHMGEVNDELQMSWASSMEAHFTSAESAARALTVCTPLFQNPSLDAYEHIRHFLAKSPVPVTAFVCFGDELAQGVLAACRDSGRPVPASISLVSILDAPSMALAYPPVTCVDTNFSTQFQVASETLNLVLGGELPSSLLHYVSPRFIERKSVLPLSFDEGCLS